MTQIVLAGLGGLFLILFAAFVLIASRRAAEIRRLLEAAAADKATAEKVAEDLEAKRVQNQQIAGQLDRAREEERRLKKRLYALEQASKSSGPTPEQRELDRIQEQALEETRAELVAAKAEIGRINDEVARLQSANERLQTELQQARRDLKQKRQARDEKDSAAGKRLDSVERENRSLAKKLEAARRKARNNEQVYRVTKSKLDLAMEKITALQKSMAGKDSGSSVS